MSRNPTIIPVPRYVAPPVRLSWWRRVVAAVRTWWARLAREDEP